MKKVVLTVCGVFLVVAIWLVNRGGLSSTPNAEEGRNGKTTTIGQDDFEKETEKRKKAELERQKNIIATELAKANVNIEFFGQVRDPNGNPIEGAKVTYRVQQPRAPWDSGMSLRSLKLS